MWLGGWVGGWIDVECYLCVHTYTYIPTARQSNPTTHPTPSSSPPPHHHTTQNTNILKKKTGGGWDPAWDALEAAKVIRPHKLHQRERDRGERCVVFGFVDVCFVDVCFWGVWVDVVVLEVVGFVWEAPASSPLALALSHAHARIAKQRPNNINKNTGLRRLRRR